MAPLIIILHFLIFSVIWPCSTERNFLKFWKIFEFFSKFHVQAETGSTQFIFNSPLSIRLISIFRVNGWIILKYQVVLAISQLIRTIFDA